MKGKIQPAKHPISLDRNTKRLIFAIIIIFGFVVYGNTISHDFAFDDVIVITKNDFTKNGIKGIGDLLTNNYLAGMYGKDFANMYRGGRYRPLSLVLFAIEYELFGQNPHINHFVNVLLYSLTGIFLFLVLWRLFEKRPSAIEQKKYWYISVPFVATLLYLAYPLHTEVVANIKGRDEIMMLLLSLISLWLTIKYSDSRKIIYLVISGVVFFLALLSKENAATFMFIIPLTIYYFNYPKQKVQVRQGKRIKSQNKSPYKLPLLTAVPLIISIVIFAIIRQNIIGAPKPGIAENPMTNPFIYATMSERYATTFYTLLIYLKLLILPHPLTFDYYPYHIPLINWGDIRAIIPLILYFIIGIIALTGLKKRTIVSYSIWIYLISFSVVSNIFFPVGVFMSERFMYVASMGFCLIIGYFLLQVIPQKIKAVKKNPVAYITPLLALLCLLYSVKTILRNPVWKDNFTLFTTDVKTSKNSLKSTAAAGELLLFKSRKTEDMDKRQEYQQLAIEYFTTTIEVYPEYINVLMYLGEVYYEYNLDYDKAMYYYKKVLEIDPDYDKVYSKVEKMMKTNQDVDYKLSIYEDLYHFNPDRFEVNYTLGAYYGAFKNELRKSVFYLERAVKFNPNSAKAFTDLGVAYAMLGNFKNSIQMLEIALKLNPNDTQLLNNLAISYEKTGNKNKSRYYLNLAQQATESKK